MRSLLDRILRGYVVLGRLSVRWPDGSLSTYAGEPGPEALVELTTDRSVRRMALNPGLAAGEEYMDGGLVPVDCSIYEVLDVLLTNLMAETSDTRVIQMRGAIGQLTRRLAQFNPSWRARRNAAHHYD